MQFVSAWICSELQYVQGREAESEGVVRQLVPVSDVQATLDSMAAELARERCSSSKSMLTVLRSSVARAQLHVGVMLQALQQLVGINTVMYFTPVILQMAGFADTRQALLLSCAPAAVNATGTVIGARPCACLLRSSTHVGHPNYDILYCNNSR